jgi:adenylate kinase family enzyme
MPAELERVVVIGTSGAGKSTVGVLLAAKLDCPFVELDELFWGPDWRPKPNEKFLSLVRRAAAGERWVCAGNYSLARPELWPRASAIVWLNFSRPVVLWRVVRRTARRLWTREVLWHGNRESVFRTLFTRQSIVWWAITTHNLGKKRYRDLRRSGQYSHLRWYEFTSPAEVERFLAERG